MISTHHTALSQFTLIIFTLSYNFKLENMESTYLLKISQLELNLKQANEELENKDKLFSTASKVGNALIKEKNNLLKINALLNEKISFFETNFVQPYASLKKLEDENTSLNMQLIHFKNLAEEYRKMALDAWSTSPVIAKAEGDTPTLFSHFENTNPKAAVSITPTKKSASTFLKLSLEDLSIPFGSKSHEATPKSSSSFPSQVVDFLKFELGSLFVEGKNEQNLTAYRMRTTRKFNEFQLANSFLKADNSVLRKDVKDLTDKINSFKLTNFASGRGSIAEFCNLNFLSSDISAFAHVSTPTSFIEKLDTDAVSNQSTDTVFEFDFGLQLVNPVNGL